MEKLLLMDGHSILNRAFYGLPDLTNSKGVHTNAVYGFLNMMFRFVESEQPTYFAVAFDLSAPTFRHKMYDAYKGTRKPMADELRQQVPMIQEMLRAMDVPVITKEGLEADDILGTLSRRAMDKNIAVTIVSGDRDLLQLATDTVKITIPKTKKGGTEIEEYYDKDVVALYGVTPLEFIDVKALMGDTSDNIPGVPSIGEKTASAIIAQYHSIENAYAHVDELKPPRASKNLLEFYDQAVMSKELAAIEVHGEFDFDFEHAILTDSKAFYTEQAYLLCKEWEFKNLLPRFEVSTPKNEIEEHFHLVNDFSKAEELFAKLEGVIPTQKKALRDCDYMLPAVGFAPLFDGDRLFGLSLFFDGEGYVILSEGFLSGAFLQERLVGLCKKGLRVSTLSLAKTLPYFDGLTPEMADDISLGAYLMNPLLNSYDVEDIAKDYLNLFVPGFSDSFGKKTMSEARETQEEEFLIYAGYLSYAAVAAFPVLLEKLKENGMEKLYYELEQPLAYTLFDMEKAGIRVDAKALEEYGLRLKKEIAILESKIYEAAGEEFNINSPKQLGEILFEKMGLEGGKKTKTGYSTAADVLEKLKYKAPIVADILEYRQLSKLNSTYVEGMGSYIGEDGKIHCKFQQTVTATGRISCTEPNLQNIPIRSEIGKEIRKVFLPKEGYTFLDADYSQIELRVLAHMSGDEALISAFKNGLDIHRDTASRVFHVPFDEVSDLQRRNAKAVNFGIVYGISAFGLSQDLNISRKEAQNYIDEYFVSYPKLKEFIDTCVNDAKESGMAKTLFGRIRPIPELSSSNFMQKQFGERVAMNSPIQGTAADIIKMAMVKVHDRLLKEGLDSKLILQVHDELLIETKLTEFDQVKEILQQEMEHAVDLCVDLLVDAHAGDTWYDAK